MQTRSKDAKTKLLDAALRVIRAKGYSATTVDDLCASAGVTKGAFFHHFKSKEALGVAAAEHWSDITGGLFADAPYHAPSDPLERLIGYIEFRREILQGEIPDFTCLVGTMVQETYQSAPAIRDACRASIFDHAGRLEADISDAMARYKVSGFSAESLALHTQAVLQGAFILAKAGDSSRFAVDSVDHLIRYVRLLFSQSGLNQKETAL